ncbi:MAG: hypothetical protein OEY11_07970 [Gammaproteobacteria bacterium]|nr:hypothetical protein [Gammaproteobacteria bacterium]
MLKFMRKYQNKISRLSLLFFVVSSLGLAAQTSAHALMMVEMQQHKAMGHEIAAHCQPVICESVLASDDQSNAGAEPLSLINISMIPASLSVVISATASSNLYRIEYLAEQLDYGPSPLQQTGLLRI